MAYEVVKRVGTRAYRYRVESYRDPATKKVRSRWTYLGIAGDETAGASVPAGPREASSGSGRRSPVQTRERLVDAFERLAERMPYASITAGAVAAEAGLAHGTFYRYFADKRAVLRAGLERVRAEFERARPSFDGPFGSVAQERARVRAWTLALGATPPARRGLLRAWFDALERDELLVIQRGERLAERTAALEAYLESLARASTIAVARPRELAAALLALVDTAFRSAIVEGEETAATTLAGVVDVFDRAIFQVASSGASATETRPDSSPK